MLGAGRSWVQCSSLRCHSPPGPRRVDLENVPEKFGDFPEQQCRTDLVIVGPTIFDFVSFFVYLYGWPQAIVQKFPESPDFLVPFSLC